jgi:hypothetical protein
LKFENAALSVGEADVRTRRVIPSRRMPRWNPQCNSATE